MGLVDRFQSAWNAFMNKDPTYFYKDIGQGNYYRPDRYRLSRGAERSIINTVYNRIAVDISSISIKHVRLDENDAFIGVIDSGLNACLTLEANIDQTCRSFMQDVVMSMFDEGVVAIVPIDTTYDPTETASFDVRSMRTGKITAWYPRHVKVLVYNDRTGKKEEITVPKETTCIIENPLYSIMNEPNSTLQRLIRKLSLLDIVDEESGSGKLDLIIQLPYIIKTDLRRQQAEKRRKEIEMQLAGSKYGIAYTDGTEKITQLNRSLENKLMSQVEYLTNFLYGQLGITTAILDGTADERTMLNYINRTLEPIISAIALEIKRKFLTKTARSQRQSIEFFTSPFKLVPLTNLAEVSDQFTRNEIMTSNEFRQILGMKPVNTERANELLNKNINPEDAAQQTSGEPITEQDYNNAMSELDSVDSNLDDLEKSLKQSDDEAELVHYASPYYDPQKAHEYYMKNRELVGRKSTKELNEEGKSAANYVKSNLEAEKKQKIAESKSQMTDEIESSRSSMQSTIEKNNEIVSEAIENDREQMQDNIARHTEQMNAEISSLYAELKDMTPLERRTNAKTIMSKIDSLRASNDSKRNELKEAFSQSSGELKEANAEARASLQKEHQENSEKSRGDHNERVQNINSEYSEKYMNELDNLKKVDAYKAQPKAKKATASKSSKKKTQKAYVAGWWHK